MGVGGRATPENLENVNCELVRHLDCIFGNVNFSYRGLQPFSPRDRPGPASEKDRGVFFCIVCCCHFVLGIGVPVSVLAFLRYGTSMTYLHNGTKMDGRA